MRKKVKTIKLAKIRRYLRSLARSKYDYFNGPIKEKDLIRIAEKIYKIARKIHIKL